MSVARFIIIIFLALTLAAFSAQFAIDFSSENIATACIVLASALSILMYINWTRAMQTHPLSTFVILGFCITTQLGALFAQSAEWASLSGGLRQPMETFSTLAFYQGVALAAHAIYRTFSSRQPLGASLPRYLLEKSGLYAIPPAGALWFMGVIGFFGYLIAGGEDVGNRISAGFKFLTWAPFLIPIYIVQFGAAYADARRNYFFLAIWISAVALLGLVMNARSVLFTGVVTVGLIYLLLGLRNHNRIRGKQVFRLGVALVVLLALIAPLSDLATAMLISRKDREKASPQQMLEKTLTVMKRPYLIEQYRNRDKAAAKYSTYDEAYIANPVFTRLVETQFHDNALYFSSYLTPAGKENLAEVTVQWLWGILPQPVLDMLKIDVDKSKLGFTVGDYLAYERYGLTLGGHKTGSVFAQGEALLGMFFPIIYLAICLALFYLMQLMTVRLKSGQIVLAAPVMMMIWEFFISSITGESLNQLLGFVLRTLVQAILIYLSMYQCSRLFTRPFVVKTQMMQ